MPDFALPVIQGYGDISKTFEDLINLEKSVSGSGQVLLGQPYLTKSSPAAPSLKLLKAFDPKSVGLDAASSPLPSTGKVLKYSVEWNLTVWVSS